MLKAPDNALHQRYPGLWLIYSLFAANFIAALHIHSAE